MVDVPFMILSALGATVVFLLAMKIGGGRSEHVSVAGEIYHAYRNERNEKGKAIIDLSKMIEWHGGYLRKIPGRRGRRRRSTEKTG